MRIKEIRKIVKLLMSKKSGCLFCSKKPEIFNNIEELSNKNFYSIYFLCEKHKKIDLTLEDISKYMYFLESNG